MAPGTLIKEQGDQSLADLLKWATGKHQVEIRFEEDDDDQWAVITLYDYKGDHELSLRLYPDDVYKLHLGYYDDEDEFIELSETLSTTQKAMVPEKLQKVLKKVLADEKGLRLPGSLLATA
jgi:hypothetical protein